MLHKATERLSAFSDGVFAVLIMFWFASTGDSTFSALLALWPHGCYAVSYLFIAIVWTNHHYLMRYATEATSRLLCSISRICFPCRCFVHRLMAGAIVPGAGLLCGGFFLVNDHICLVRELVDRTHDGTQSAESCASGRSRLHAFRNGCRLLR